MSVWRSPSARRATLRRSLFLLSSARRFLTLQHGRPKTSDRHVFLRAVAPLQPIGTAAVSGRARYYLLKAGVNVPRPGSHTLRHSAVQRLVDANFDLKTIGDFVGHRSPRSTEIYAKVAVEALREVALGDGESVLK
nr:tyrosine-type recombinase/integrase [Cryobacterium sp. Hb1]